MTCLKFKTGRKSDKKSRKLTWNYPLFNINSGKHAIDAVNKYKYNDL